MDFSLDIACMCLGTGVFIFALITAALTGHEDAICRKDKKPQKYFNTTLGLMVISLALFIGSHSYRLMVSLRSNQEETTTEEDTSPAISSGLYNTVINWVEEYPELKLQVRLSLSDGKITDEEWDEIWEAKTTLRDTKKSAEEAQKSREAVDKLLDIVAPKSRLIPLEDVED